MSSQNSSSSTNDSFHAAQQSPPTKTPPNPPPPQNTIEARLEKLELLILGSTQTEHEVEDRINRLEKVSSQSSLSTNSFLTIEDFIADHLRTEIQFYKAVFSDPHNLGENKRFMKDYFKRMGDIVGDSTPDVGEKR